MEKINQVQTKSLKPNCFYRVPSIYYLEFNSNLNHLLSWNDKNDIVINLQEPFLVLNHIQRTEKLLSHLNINVIRFWRDSYDEIYHVLTRHGCGYITIFTEDIKRYFLNLTNINT